METLKAISIHKLGLDLEYSGDLLYYEGPLLSHYIDKQDINDHYLYKWVDSDNRYHRWMVFKVDSGNIFAFLNGKISILELIEYNSLCYFLDIDAHQEVQHIRVSSVGDIPKDYLPTEDSFFEEEQYETYALELKSSLQKHSSVGSDLEEYIQQIKKAIESISITGGEYLESIFTSSESIPTYSIPISNINSKYEIGKSTSRATPI